MPALYLQHGRVYTNHLKPDTHHDFAGACVTNIEGSPMR
jgi:hypothetical protein